MLTAFILRLIKLAWRLPIKRYQRIHNAREESLPAFISTVEFIINGTASVL
jgi:hypothetical protein